MLILLAFSVTSFYRKIAKKKLQRKSIYLKVHDSASHSVQFASCSTCRFVCVVYVIFSHTCFAVVFLRVPPHRTAWVAVKSKTGDLFLTHLAFFNYRLLFEIVLACDLFFLFLFLPLPRILQSVVLSVDIQWGCYVFAGSGFCSVRILWVWCVWCSWNVVVIVVYIISLKKAAESSGIE